MTFEISAEDQYLKVELKGVVEKEILKKLGISSDPPSFRIAPTRAFEFVKQLGATGRLQWQGRKMVVDPFTEVEIEMEALYEEGSLLLEGKWKRGARSGPLADCSWIFFGDPSFCILNSCIYPIKGDCDPSKIRWIYPQPSLFEGKEAATLAHELDIPAKVQVNGIPFLVLRDRHGAFADLFFDYGDFGKVAFHEGPHPFWRNRTSEMGFEKDLLETEFTAKWLDKSRYYCPLDKVAKNLGSILDRGWKIFDCHNRQVLRQKKEEVHTEVDQGHILIRGKIHYENQSADLKDVVRASGRKERFVALSSTTVGLLDGGKWEALTEHEVISDAIAVKKYRVGQLAELLHAEKATHDYSELFRTLPAGWQIEPKTVSNRFQGELFPYQKEGLKWLEFLREGGCGGLLADEMGLGKTVQVVAFFSQLAIAKPCLIVVPTSLLFNWRREFERFLPSCPVHVHAKKGTLEDFTTPGVILTSYALLRLEPELFKAIQWQVIVLDEAQAIKNPSSQIAQVAFGLQGDMRLAITGTPIENRLQDLFSLFQFALPDLLDAECDFKSVLRPFLLRRKKEAVLQDLPPKMEQVVFVDMTETQRHTYDQWLQRTKAGLIQKVSLDGTSAHRMEILEAILRLRQLCVHPFLVGGEGEFLENSGKCEQLFQDLQEVVDSGKKVLVYSQFTTMLQLIRREVANRGWSYVYLDGATTDREGVVRQFQEEESTSIFLISLKAGGVGLNLTAADYVFLLDPWWNEAVEQQAIDRAHRVGRRGTVIARRYVTTESIEEKMMTLKKHKLNLAQGLFEECGDFTQLSLDDLIQLIF